MRLSDLILLLVEAGGERVEDRNIRGLRSIIPDERG